MTTVADHASTSRRKAGGWLDALDIPAAWVAEHSRSARRWAGRWRGRLTYVTLHPLPATHPRRLRLLFTVFWFAYAGLAWNAFGVGVTLTAMLLLALSVAATSKIFASRSSRHSVSAAAIVVDDSDRLLLVQRRDNGRWQPPGGVVEANETVPAGLIREVREETGLQVRPVALTGIYRHVDTRVLSFVFHCDVIGGRRARSTIETAACEWLPVEEARRRLDRAFAARVDDALARVSSPFVSAGHFRDHSGPLQLTAADLAATATASIREDGVPAAL